jgi:hypothetical protein
MKNLIASTVYCPDRTEWSWVGEDIWQCCCCGMRIASEDLVEPIEVAA